MKSTKVNSLKDMELLAIDLIRDYTQRPLILALEGNLGSGKTTFAQYIGKTIGIKDKMTSPTFILHIEYDGLDHLDLYRLEFKVEFDELRIPGMLVDNKIIIIEWADKFKNKIINLKTHAKIVWIKFEHGGENSRLVKIYDNENFSN